MMRILQIGLASALALASFPLHAQQHVETVGTTDETADTGRWVTLGTRAGPVASSTRSQPANLLIAGGQNILVDVGDGTAGQLAEIQISNGTRGRCFYKPSPLGSYRRPCRASGLACPDQCATAAQDLWATGHSGNGRRSDSVNGPRCHRWIRRSGGTAR